MLLLIGSCNNLSTNPSLLFLNLKNILLIECVLIFRSSYLCDKFLLGGNDRSKKKKTATYCSRSHEIEASGTILLGPLSR